jgi:16S rRNA (guanine1207-N2)-methyltransferase
VPGDHYFAAEPGVPSSTRTVVLTLPDLTMTLTTDRGVFAHGSVDTGTKLLLLEGPPVPADGDVLDLGCGYGPIACTLAQRSPGATVWAVDVNERARALCTRNAAANELANVRVVAPDDVPDDVRFAAIWSNPPIRVGKTSLHELLTTWLGRLAPGGAAHLVVQRHLGADSLAAWLGRQGWTVARRASRQGYRLLDVTPASPHSPVAPISTLAVENGAISEDPEG